MVWVGWILFGGIAVLAVPPVIWFATRELKK